MKKIVLFIFLFISIIGFSKNWYLNDGSRIGDVYCTAIGSASGTGLSPGSPKLFATGSSNTLKSLIASAAFSPGDVIFIDAMDVQMGSASSGSEIPFNKALTIIGAGPNKTILKGPLSSAAVTFGVISSSNVVFKNFKCSNWSGSSSGSASCLEIVASSSDISGIIIDGFWFDQNLGSGGDGACIISSSGTGTVSAVIKNMLTTCNNAGSYAGGFTIKGDGHRINFSNCYFYNNQRSTNGGAINILGESSSDANTTIVTFDKCKFQNNSSLNGFGGAIAVAGAKLIVTNSCFSNNSLVYSGSYGSAIAGLKFSRIQITNCSFSSNSGGKYGHISLKSLSDFYTKSGIYELIIDKCSFDNTNSNDYKCVYFGESGTFSITNSTFTTAGTSQIYAPSSSWSLTNSARSAGVNPTYNIAPSTVNTLVPSSTPTPTCNGSVFGSCGSLSISCTSDNLPPIIKGYDSTYVTNSACTFTVPAYTATDLCDPSPTVTSVPAAGTALASGATTPVVITATDASGNSSSITVYLTTPACTSTCVRTLTSASGTDAQSICLGSSITNITYATAIATGITNDGVSGANGLPAGVSATFSGNATSGTITISGTPTESGTFNYNIPLTGGCESINATGTLTITPLDNASFTYPSNSFCSTSDPNPIANITGKSGGVFSISPSGAVFSANTGLINLSTSTAGSYTITYKTNGTCPNTQIANLSIGSNPAINAISDQSICSGTTFNTINFTGTPSTVFEWTNSNPSIGLATSGTGNIPSFIGNNNTNSPVSASIKVIPKSGSCTGASKSFLLTVKPLDNASFSYSNTSFCTSFQADPTASITGLSGGTFTSTPVGLSINSVGTIDLVNSTPGNYSVKYSTNGNCPNTQTTNISLGSSPSVDAISNQSICSGATFSAINFTGNPGTEFKWTNSDPTIGLPASGTGDIPSFKAINTTNTISSAKITVTPLVGTCIGASTSFTLTVIPLDNASFSYSKSSFCNTDANPTPTITGVSGGAFTSTPVGLSINSSTGMINIVNSTQGNYQVTYQSSGTCGATASTSIAINNNPFVNAISDQSICSGTTFNAINFTGTSGTVFEWTNSNPTIGLAASGTGNIAAFIGVNNSDAPISSTITITPRSGSCFGASQSFSLTVKPLDNASFSYSNTSFCKNESNPTPTITGIVGGTFTSIPVGLSINSVGTINLVNSAPGNYDVKYTTNGQCPNVSTFPVSIGSNPAVNQVSDQTICQGANFNTINFTGNPGTVFQWTNSNSTIGLPSNGIGNISSFLGTSIGSSVIVVTPKIGSCLGASKTFSLIVNSQNTPTFTQLGPYCKDQTPVTLALTSNNGIAGTWDAAISTSTVGIQTYTFTPTSTAVPTCATTKTMDIEVKNVTVPTFTQLGAYCKDAIPGTLPLTSINGIAGTWNAAISTSTVGTQTYTFTPTSSAAPTCATTATMSVEIKDATVPTFTQLGAYCKDATPGTLPLTSINGIAGTWNSAISTSTVGTQTYTFTPTSSAAPTCATTKKMDITVNSSTNADPISGDTDICKGSTSQLTNNTPNGVWSSSNTSVATVNSSGLVTAVSEGFCVIKYDVTGISSCSQSAEKPFRVIGLPFVNDVQDQQVCEGASFNPINFSGSTGATFNWTNSDVKIGLDASGSGNINAFIAKGTTIGGSAFTSYISVKPTIGNCIGNIYILKLSVSPRENASFSYNSNVFCKNQTDPTPVISGTKGGSFTAITTGLVLDNVTGSIKLSASSPGNHTVIYKTAGKCNTNQSVSFVINNVPIVDSISHYTICPGSFNDSIKFKGTTGASFEWINSNTATGLPANGQSMIYPFDARNFGSTNVISEISVTPRIGQCIGSARKFNITVRVVPKLLISQLDTIVCPGGNINFKTVLTPSINTPVYQWYVNDAKVGANSSLYWSKTLKSKDKITVNVTSKDFCPTTATIYVRMDSLRLSMNVPTMVYLKSPAVNLIGYPSGGVFSGKGVANNKFDPSVLGVGNKIVTYSYKNANNCSSEISQKVVVYDTVPNNCHTTTYDTVKVNVTDTVSILKIKFKLTTGIKANQETSLRVYPNPTSDILLIEAADEKALAGYRYKMLDAAGKEVYNQPVKSIITEISLKSLGAAGTYFFEVFDEKLQRVVSKKIILD